MNRTSRFTLIVAAAALTLSGASSQAQSTTASPNVASNKLAVKLLQGLQSVAPQENVVMSPTSLATVFTLVTAGASVNDQKLILKAIGYDNMSMQEALKDSETFEKSLSTSADYSVTSKNALYTNATLVPAYKKTIESSLKAHNEIVNFEKPATADTVNAWANKSTNGLIKEIVTKDEIEMLAFLGLNATFLDAKWAVNFDSPRARGGGMEFIGDDGKVMQNAGKPVTVPLMTSNPSMPVVAADFGTYMVYDIPYKLGANGKPQGSLQILLPKITNEAEVQKALWSGGAKVEPKMATVGAVVQSLTDASLDDIQQAIELNRVQRGRSFMIHIPKFKSEYTSENDTLKNLVTAWGAGSIFNRIDLSGMVADLNWNQSKIALIKQKATIEISETGTKAAAVSAIGGFPESCPPPQIYVNRPFAYLVRDGASGRVVFAGTYMNPLLAAQP